MPLFGMLTPSMPGDTLQQTSEIRSAPRPSDQLPPASLSVPTHLAPPPGPLPPYLCAASGPESRFIWRKLFEEGSEMLERMLHELPEEASCNQAFAAGIRRLQCEMRQNQPLGQLEVLDDPRVAAAAWNRHLQELNLDAEEEEPVDWSHSPWIVAEGYLFKRLLQELVRCDIDAAACCDPWKHQKTRELKSLTDTLSHIAAQMEVMVDTAVDNPVEVTDRRDALAAMLMLSLWACRDDLKLQGRTVKTAGKLISDECIRAVNMLNSCLERPIILVLGAYGAEALCDLALADALLRLTSVSRIQLHVQDAPTALRGTAAGDIEGLISWWQEQIPALGSRLRANLKTGTIRIASSAFYTSGKPFSQMPPALLKQYSQAAFVILKGDMNYRRVLGDRRWPCNMSLTELVGSFWPTEGLLVLRTVQSPHVIGINRKTDEQATLALLRDSVLQGNLAQVLVFWRRPEGKERPEDHNWTKFGASPPGGNLFENS